MRLNFSNSDLAVGDLLPDPGLQTAPLNLRCEDGHGVSTLPGLQ